MSDFFQHTALFLVTLAVVCVGTALHAPAEVLAPLSGGLGMALPALLGGHAIASGVRAYRDGSDSTAGDSK